MIAISCVGRFRMAGRVFDWEYLDLHVGKIAAVSRKGAYSLLKESAGLS